MKSIKKTFNNLSKSRDFFSSLNTFKRRRKLVHKNSFMNHWNFSYYRRKCTQNIPFLPRKYPSGIYYATSRFDSRHYHISLFSRVRPILPLHQKQNREVQMKLFSKTTLPDTMYTFLVFSFLLFSIPSYLSEWAKEKIGYKRISLLTSLALAAFDTKFALFE